MDTRDEREVEVTLHVVEGEVVELEIWTGELGEIAEPDVASVRYEETYARDPA